MRRGLPCTANLMVAPSERPIQLRCMSLMLSGQCRSSRSSRSLSAYSVMRSIHCSTLRTSIACCDLVLTSTASIGTIDFGSSG